MSKAVLGWVERTLFGIGALMTAMIAVVIVLQIIARYFFNHPLTWPEEVVQFLLIASVFVGLGVIERANGHIRCEFLVNRCSQKVAVWLAVLGKGLTLCLIAGFLIGEGTLLERVKLLTTPAAQIPRLWLHVIVLFAIGCWTLYLVATSISLLWGGPAPRETNK